MPIYDYHCRCGNVRKDKYFPHFSDVSPVICMDCGEEMDQDAPRIVFDSFKPFTTRNIRKDGKPVHITCKSQWERVMRENHVVPHPFNDSVEAKADVREIGRAVAEDRARFPARYRKLKEEVKALGIEAVDPIAKRAQDTRFETKRI